MGKKANKWTKEHGDPYLKQLLKRAEKDFLKCSRRINNEIHDEVKKMYKTFIEQFYDYKTTSYIRHFEGKPGTQHGENLLYPWEGIRKNNHSSSSPKLIIEFWANEMSNEPKYKFDTPEHVLDSVLHGIRFAYATGESGPMWVDTTFKYTGKYFSYTCNTIQEAFDRFGKDWDNISHNAFYSIWDEYVSKWKVESI